jgi:hypothetical protein
MMRRKDLLVAKEAASMGDGHKNSSYNTYY